MTASHSFWNSVSMPGTEVACIGRGLTALFAAHVECNDYRNTRSASMVADQARKRRHEAIVHVVQKSGRAGSDLPCYGSHARSSNNERGAKMARTCDVHNIGEAELLPSDWAFAFGLNVLCDQSLLKEVARFERDHRLLGSLSRDCRGQPTGWGQ